MQLVKTTVWSTISNPIVFMTLIGIIANFILKQKIPGLIDPILLTLSNSFSALALFYLGYTMVGKIKNLTFSSVVIIIILIFTKSLIYPLINREIILHLSAKNITMNESESLSSFGFLYGTFPAAPSLFFYISRYKAIDDGLISAALVMGTLASAPLMMISGKMISLKYNSSAVSNFEDIECKTAYGFSILSWFCCIWVLYIFLASGRGFLKSHSYALMLILSQMSNSLVHIVWSNITTNVETLDPIYGYIHVMLVLFFAFVTRCLPLSMLLNIFSISGVNHRTRTFRVLTRLSNSRLFLSFIGIVVPVIAVGICAAAGNIPTKQSMIISISKAQIIISNCLLFLIVTAVFYFMIVFVRTKNEHNSFVKFLSSQMTAMSNKRRSHYSFSTDAPTSNGSDLVGNGIRRNQAGIIHNRNDSEDLTQDADDSQSLINSNGNPRSDYVYLIDEQAGNYYLFIIHAFLIVGCRDCLS
jgi:hypothetical protein